MNSTAKKITPLFFLLVMTLSTFTYAPSVATSISTASTPTSSFAPPTGTHWTNWSSSYAIYNGHRTQSRNEYMSGFNGSEFLMTATMTAIPSGAYSNVSVALKEFFTGVKPENVEGLWYIIGLSDGNVVDSWKHQPGINGYPMFFYLPNAWTYSLDDIVSIAAPFSETGPIAFKVVGFDAVLGIPCVIVNYAAYSYSYNYETGEEHEINQNITLWLNTNIGDDSGLLMRIIGYDRQHHSYSFGADWYESKTEMSMEIGETNILTLGKIPIEEGLVPWMQTGKYIQYDIQGSAYIDASLIDHVGGVTYQLPGDARFRATVSANVTLKVDRGTTAYVDPYGTSRYVWVLHLMLNNTQLLLPDLRRSVQYLNGTLGMPLEYADMLIGMLSPFNQTGMVADTWFLVDNASGQMYWPGVHFSSLSGFSPSMTATIGDILSQGLGLQLLSWFAQSYMYQGWSLTNPPETQIIHMNASDIYSTRWVDGTLAASIVCVGTEYLNFPGGGGGQCWRIDSNLVSHIVESAISNNRSMGPQGFSPAVFMDNSTIDITGNGFVDIERTSGFPLGFGLQLRFTLASEPRFLPYYWFSMRVDVGLSLSVRVPKTNIWFSNPPVNLILGTGGNATSPESTFGNYGFDVWTNNAQDVVVTSSASPPPDTAAPPSGALPLVYLDVRGEPIGSGNVILYVFYNRTRVHDLGISEDSLKLYTFNITTSQWQELVSTRLTINATHGVLFAVLTHFSYFAVLGSAPSGGMPTFYIIIAAVAVIAVLGAVVYVKKGRGGPKLKLQVTPTSGGT